MVLIGGIIPERCAFLFLYLHELGHTLTHIGQVLAFGVAPGTDEFCVGTDLLVQSLVGRVDVLELAEPFVDTLVVAPRMMTYGPMSSLYKCDPHIARWPASREEGGCCLCMPGTSLAAQATAHSLFPLASVQLRPTVSQSMDRLDRYPSEKLLRPRRRSCPMLCILEVNRVWGLKRGMGGVWGVVGMRDEDEGGRGVGRKGKRRAVVSGEEERRSGLTLSHTSNKRALEINHGSQEPKFKFATGNGEVRLDEHSTRPKRTIGLPGVGNRWGWSIELPPLSHHSYGIAWDSMA